MLMKLHNRHTGSDRQMQAASKDINEVCGRLNLPDMVKNSALEVFRDVGLSVLGVFGQACRLVLVGPNFCSCAQHACPMPAQLLPCMSMLQRRCSPWTPCAYVPALMAVSALCCLLACAATAFPANPATINTVDRPRTIRL